MEYRRGKENLVANGLSKKMEDLDGTLLMVTLVSIPQLQLLQELKQKLEDDHVVQELLLEWERNELNQKYTVKEGVLYYKQRVYVANNADIKAKLLSIMHDGPTGSDSGYDKTMH